MIDELHDDPSDPTPTPTTAPNAIIELDAHVNPPDKPWERAPSVPHDRHSMLADYCQKLGFDTTSAEIEIFRRAHVDDQTTVCRYTADHLTEILLDLALVKSYIGYDDELDLLDEGFELSSAIGGFARFVMASTDAPLASWVKDIDPATLDIPDTYCERIKIADGDGDYIDPVSVTVDNQELECWMGDEVELPNPHTTY